MKSVAYFFVILILFLSPGLFSQTDYTVIKVNGSIMLKASGKSLIQGTVFGEKEELFFGSENSRAAVVNPGKGRFVLAPVSTGTYVAKTCMLPPVSNISSRGGTMLTLLDFQNHFTGKIVFLGKNTIRIGDSSYPMDSSNFFFLRYKYHGDNINKKLTFRSDTVFFDRDQILTIDNQPIPHPDTATMKMYYRRGNESVFLSEFTAVFPNEDELKKEIEILLNTLQNLKFDEKLNQVISFVNEFYGKPDKENISSWLKASFTDK